LREAGRYKGKGKGEAMNIGVIGPGNIGEAVIRKLRDQGYRVKMANERGPESLKDLGAKTGAIPVSVEQVVQDVDMLFMVVPQKAIPKLPKGLLNKARKETIVIDVGNYYPFRDGRIDELENGLTESVWVERQIGRPMIKVLNTIPSKALMAAGRPAGSKDRVALPISGDNTKAKSLLNSFIELVSILLTPEQSRNRGGNSLDFLFTAPIRRRRNFGCG
jgi:predicted dinucleotide-binding enzyme